MNQLINGSRIMLSCLTFPYPVTLKDGIFCINPAKESRKVADLKRLAETKREKHVVRCTLCGHIEKIYEKCRNVFL